MLDRIAKIGRSERGGRTGGGGYEYQHNWVLFEALKLLREKRDFTVVVEYHEDVVFLFPEDDPPSIQLCQIKKMARGRWTLRKLSKPTKKQSLSPLAKIVRNLLDVGASDTVARFSTNAHFNFGEDGNTDELGGSLLTRLADLAGKEAVECKKKVASELQLQADFDVVFERHFLQSTSYEDQTFADLSRYLESIGHGHLRVVPLHSTLLQEIRRRAVAEWPEPDAYAVLSESTIESTQLQGWIAQAAAHASGSRYSERVGFLLDDCTPAQKARSHHSVAAAESLLLAGNKKAHEFVSALRAAGISIGESVFEAADSSIHIHNNIVERIGGTTSLFPTLGLALIAVIDEIESQAPAAPAESPKQET